MRLLFILTIVIVVDGQRDAARKRNRIDEILNENLASGDASRNPERPELQDFYPIDRTHDNKEVPFPGRERMPERKSFNFADMYSRNVGFNRPLLQGTPRKQQPRTQIPDSLPKNPQFDRGTFNLRGKGPNVKQDKAYNWTTCDEFGRYAVFHPRDVVNIDWIPFFCWGSEHFVRPIGIVHRFSFPTGKLVRKYKSELDRYLEKEINWSKPKLLLHAERDSLLVAVDRKGEFNALPYNEVPNYMKDRNVTLPLINLRLKQVGQYLAMMYCEHQYAIIMAVAGTEPDTLDKQKAAAAVLKFKGAPGNNVFAANRIDKLLEPNYRRNQKKQESGLPTDSENKTF